MHIKISDIKAGDKIQLKQGNEWYIVSLIAEERVYTTTMDESCTIRVAIKDITRVYSTDIKETTNESQQPKQHKHKDLIIAWANGAEVQYMDNFGEWIDVKAPYWYTDTTYRIKPVKPKNNTKRMYVEYKSCIDNAWNKPNLELEFDAESGELVKATILK